MRYRCRLLLALLFCSSLSMANNPKIVYGYVEKATLVDKNMILSAKLDTGAKSASLSAKNIKEVKKSGKTYLQFTVLGKHETMDFTAPYLGKVRIKVRSQEHSPLEKMEPIRRPVVLMRIQIGDVVRDIAVNLTNRKRFNYPLLLGRDAIIAFNGLVDPSQAFLLRTENLKKNEVK
ncbi:MAG: RimK/LysX family protein [Proteobacteria bacterium]|nr:RimK/LysX family protein [Pseudomonadota bacterium]